MSEEKTTIENTDHLSEEEVRSLKLKQLKQSDRTPYAYNFDKKNSTQEIINNFNSLETGESNETVVQLAGRIMAKRAHGKAFFGNIIDQSNNIQFYAN